MAAKENHGQLSRHWGIQDAGCGPAPYSSEPGGQWGLSQMLLQASYVLVTLSPVVTAGRKPGHPFLFHFPNLIECLLLHFISELC